MASKARIYDQTKLLGQVYTPPHIVEKILHHAGFFQQFQGKKILDPACGDGRFLVPIAKHIIRNSPAEAIVENLSQIHGWDIDENAVKLCRQNLDELTEGLNVTINWKLRHADALKQLNAIEKYDLIIGNPPYIRIQHLPDDQRKFVQTAYSFCKIGSTDAFVAFFELALSLLSDTGVCGFITPNSYLSSQTAMPLRDYFKENQNLIHITNYGAIQLFENTGTYSAVTVFDRGKRNGFFYEKSDRSFRYHGREVTFSELKPNTSWQLAMTHPKDASGKRLGDICKISVGITTLSDAFYLFTILSEDDGHAHVISKEGRKLRLEKGLLKPIVKGSKLKSSTDPIKEYVLFPYQKDSTGKHRIIPEDHIRTFFPSTYAYLLSIKPFLDKRDNGKPNPAAWYAFGRGQSLDSPFGRKIIFSPMNAKPNFILYDDPECTVYSGYFIKYDGDYEWLLAQLNSQRMADFIAITGRDFQGEYKGYNKKIVENFIVTDIPESLPV